MRSPKLPQATWEAVRTLAQLVGVREAARQYKDQGVTEEAAKKRSQRERWSLDGPFGKVAKSVPVLSPVAAMAAQAFAYEINTLSVKTRLGLARAQAAVAEHVEGREGAENLSDAQNIKAAAQTANMVFGWDKQTPAPRFRLELLGGKCEGLVVDVEAIGDSSAEW